MFKNCTLKTLKQVREKLKKTTRWKEIQSSWIGSLHFVKMIILSKLVYRLKQFQSKFQKTSFIKSDKVTPKLIMVMQRTQKSQNKCERRKLDKGKHCQDCSDPPETTGRRCRFTERQTAQWDRIQSPEVDPHIQDRLI